jgi:microcystin-dependent protein
MNAIQALAVAKSYTDSEIAGAGAIKGAPCQIQSITDITGGHRVTFLWVDNEEVSHTSTLDVMDGDKGDDGVGIASITFKDKDASGNNVYTVTMTDNTTYDITCPKGDKGDDGEGIIAGGTTGQVLTKKSNTDYDTEWKNPSSADGLPIGTIISFMGINAPNGYLSCDGTVYNIEDCSELALFFEDQFGSKNVFGGDGVTTFAVPDLRGEFLRGTGTNGHSGQGNGADVGTHQDATNLVNLNSWSDGSARNISFSDTNINPNYDSVSSTKHTTAFINGSTTTGQKNDSGTTRPTNTSVMWCIKAS